MSNLIARCLFNIIVLFSVTKLFAGDIIPNLNNIRAPRGDSYYNAPFGRYDLEKETVLSRFGIRFEQHPIIVRYNLTFHLYSMANEDDQDRSDNSNTKYSLSCMGSVFKSSNNHVVILTSKHCIVPVLFDSYYGFKSGFYTIKLLKNNFIDTLGLSSALYQDFSANAIFAIPTPAPKSKELQDYPAMGENNDVAMIIIKDQLIFNSLVDSSLLLANIPAIKGNTFIAPPSRQRQVNPFVFYGISRNNNYSNGDMQVSIYGSPWGYLPPENNLHYTNSSLIQTSNQIPLGFFGIRETIGTFHAVKGDDGGAFYMRDRDGLWRMFALYVGNVLSPVGSTVAVRGMNPTIFDIVINSCVAENNLICYFRNPSRY